MNTQELSQKKISELVAENIKTAHVFKKYGIDFCCGGGVSIAKACEKSGTDLEVIIQELTSVNNKKGGSQDFNSWELDFLADYIVNTHHRYVAESLVMINEYSLKVAKVHGEHHPPVVRVYELFEVVANELWEHMKKEENVLFPYIKKMVEAKRSENTLGIPSFVSAKNPIAMMEHEHETVGNILKEIAVLTNQYTPPEWACNTFKALYEKLDEFEQDLHIHIHLENNILFPKAIALETSLMN